LQEYNGPTFQEEYSDDPIFQTKKLSNLLGTLIRQTAKKNLDAGILVGAISVQLLLVDTWKALRNHPHSLLRKRIEDAINT
jgi:hypothetical protein